VSKTDLSNIFGHGGLLEKKLSYYHPRPEQLDMACAVSDAINSVAVLVAEAATGTGKTFAYLIPALLSGKKILISTATKNLQDQLVQHDIPKILAILGIARTVVNLKGRDNYLCKYKIEQISQHSNAISSEYVQEITKIYEQIPFVSIGEKADILNVTHDAPLWHGVTAHVDNCIASKCPVQSECFMYKIRQKALDADCVVVNHHLFFADSRLKQDGFGALLPKFEIFIFDEAHQLPNTALHFYSKSFSTTQFLHLLNEIDSQTLLDSTVHLQLKRQVHALETHIKTFDEDFQKNPQVTKIYGSEFIVSLNTWLNDIVALINILNDLATKVDERWLDRLSVIAESIRHCLNFDDKGVAWIKALKKHVKFQWSPFDVSSQVKELLASLEASLIFTSATLSTAGSFTWFLKDMGIEGAKVRVWNSPFDWHKQSLLYIPRGIPDVYAANYHQIFLEKVWPVIERLGGKTFILFTSHHSLNWAAEYLQRRSINMPILVQGSADKTILLNNFKQHGQAILLGTGSFWEGVDVQGQALSCVVIDKLPFANVKEPLMAGKINYIKKQGNDAFIDLQLPQAIITLKQGVGRLIRTELDYGVLIIGDPRLIAKRYGAEIKRSLPPMPWTRNLDKVLTFINQHILSIG